MNAPRGVEPEQPTLFETGPVAADHVEDDTPGPKFATVVPNVPVPGQFTYTVPPALRGEVQVGLRVRVPFGRRRVQGYVLELPETCDVPVKKLKPIAEILDRVPTVSADILRLAIWASTYYHAPLGEVLSTAVPKGVQARNAQRDPQSWVVRTEAEPAAKLGIVQTRVLQALADGPLALKVLRQRTHASSEVFKRLEQRGLIEFRDEPPDPPPPGALPELTQEQVLALQPPLRQLAGEQEPGVTLLFGVTGSGKTEVYLRAIAKALEAGKGAIVLVPEIALTPQTLERFRIRFGGGVAELHSALSTHERRREWRRIQSGEAQVVVGPRSAVWAPVQNLGLIVVDEEHEATYKQESAPRYHARDLAVVRGALAKVPVILGSATPSLESYYNAVQGRYKIVRMRSRPGGSVLPKVQIVDMGQEWSEVKGAPMLSRALVAAMREALQRGERVLLFQNRRGFTTFLMCPSCKFVLKCKQCDITLTYHRAMNATVCHFCDWRQPPPVGPCPACLGPHLKQRGAGTEKIEEIVRRQFPHAEIGRLDTDVVRGGDTAEEVIERFRRGDLHVLVGTQMIAKGLDIAEVTVVGVISADTSLSLPDFRAAERTFQLVAQVAGRAGRGAHKGRTVVQTFLPEHVAILTASAHRYEEFARSELPYREALSYPPYGRLLKILYRGEDEELVSKEAEVQLERIKELARHDSEVTRILGPAPSPRAYLTGKYRYQALIKGNANGLRRVIAALDALPSHRAVSRVIDVDPFHMT